MSRINQTQISPRVWVWVSPVEENIAVWVRVSPKRQIYFLSGSEWAPPFTADLCSYLLIFSITVSLVLAYIYTQIYSHVSQCTHVHAPPEYLLFRNVNWEGCHFLPPRKVFHGKFLIKVSRLSQVFDKNVHTGLLIHVFEGIRSKGASKSTDYVRYWK